MRYFLLFVLVSAAFGFGGYTEQEVCDLADVVLIAKVKSRTQVHVNTGVSLYDKAPHIKRRMQIERVIKGEPTKLNNYADGQFDWIAVGGVAEKNSTSQATSQATLQATSHATLQAVLGLERRYYLAFRTEAGKNAYKQYPLLSFHELDRSASLPSVQVLKEQLSSRCH